MEVVSVIRDSYSGLWNVHYKRHVPLVGYSLQEYVMKSKYVILGAGVLGTTKILLQSKKRGLRVSEQLGKRLSSNGDFTGFCLDTRQGMNAIGNNTSVGVIKEHEVPSGPANTMVLDLRSVPKDPKDDMVIMDLTIPTPVRIPYSVAIATAAGLISGCHKPSDREWEETFEVCTDLTVIR